MNRIGFTDIVGWILFLVGIGCIAFSICYQRKMEAPADGIYLGQLEIPQIDVNLPIYEGVADTVLENGVGHLSESSHFGKGIGSHCLFAGHRGLPNQALLIRLGELKVGDEFVIRENQAYSYRVCDIQVIRPEDTQCLKTNAEKELVSLITCTPVGVNTHRLVVTGERINENEITKIYHRSTMYHQFLYTSCVCGGRNDTDTNAGGTKRQRCTL